LGWVARWLGNTRRRWQRVSTTGKSAFLIIGATGRCGEREREMRIGVYRRAEQNDVDVWRSVGKGCGRERDWRVRALASAFDPHLRLPSHSPWLKSVTVVFAIT
jgi:hypothetical protein